MFRSRKGAKSCFAEPISCFKESKVNHPRTPPLPAIFSTLSGCLSSPGKLGKGLGEPGELAMWQVNAWWNSLNHRIIFGVRTAETQQKTSGRGKCCSVNILKFRKTFASLLLQILQELYACWYLDTFCKNYSIKPKFEKKKQNKGLLEIWIITPETNSKNLPALQSDAYPPIYRRVLSPNQRSPPRRRFETCSATARTGDGFGKSHNPLGMVATKPEKWCSLKIFQDQNWWNQWFTCSKVWCPSGSALWKGEYLFQLPGSWGYLGLPDEFISKKNKPWIKVIIRWESEK